MRRGDFVYVEQFSGKRVKMVIWQVLESTVWVCTPNAYERALKSGRKPQVQEVREWAFRPAQADDD